MRYPDRLARTMLRLVEPSFEADSPSVHGRRSQDGQATARIFPWPRRIDVSGLRPMPTMASPQPGEASDSDFVRRELRQHLPALQRYARSLTGNASRADDLVHDCAERALSRAHLWRQGNLRA